jgi:hypothetical protein
MRDRLQDQVKDSPSRADTPSHWACTMLLDGDGCSFGRTGAATLAVVAPAPDVWPRTAYAMPLPARFCMVLEATLEHYAAEQQRRHDAVS